MQEVKGKNYVPVLMLQTGRSRRNQIQVPVFTKREREDLLELLPVTQANLRTSQEWLENGALQSVCVPEDRFRAISKSGAHFRVCPFPVTDYSRRRRGKGCTLRGFFDAYYASTHPGHRKSTAEERRKSLEGVYMAGLGSGNSIYYDQDGICWTYGNIKKNWHLPRKPALIVPVGEWPFGHVPPSPKDTEDRCSDIYSRAAVCIAGAAEAAAAAMVKHRGSLRTRHRISAFIEERTDSALKEKADTCQYAAELAGMDWAADLVTGDLYGFSGDERMIVRLEVLVHPRGEKKDMYAVFVSYDTGSKLSGLDEAASVYVACEDHGLYIVEDGVFLPGAYTWNNIWSRDYPAPEVRIRLDGDILAEPGLRRAADASKIKGRYEILTNPIALFIGSRLHPSKIIFTCVGEEQALCFQLLASEAGFDTLYDRPLGLLYLDMSLQECTEFSGKYKKELVMENLGRPPAFPRTGRTGTKR